MTGQETETQDLMTIWEAQHPISSQQPEPLSGDPDPLPGGKAALQTWGSFPSKHVVQEAVLLCQRKVQGPFSQLGQEGTHNQTNSTQRQNCLALVLSQQRSYLNSDHQPRL